MKEKLKVYVLVCEWVDENCDVRGSGVQVFAKLQDAKDALVKAAEHDYKMYLSGKDDLEEEWSDDRLRYEIWECHNYDILHYAYEITEAEVQ